MGRFLGKTRGSCLISIITISLAIGALAILGNRGLLPEWLGVFFPASIDPATLEQCAIETLKEHRLLTSDYRIVASSRRQVEVEVFTGLRCEQARENCKEGFEQVECGGRVSTYFITPFGQGCTLAYDRALDWEDVVACEP